MKVEQESLTTIQFCLSNHSGLVLYNSRVVLIHRAEQKTAHIVFFILISHFGSLFHFTPQKAKGTMDVDVRVAV